MKKVLFVLCLTTFLSGCDYWPSHYFYIENSIPDSEITIEFDSTDTKNTDRENTIKTYTLEYGQKKLVRVVGSANTGTKRYVKNVFIEYKTYPEILPFTLYVNGEKIDKILYTKDFWQFTSHEGYGDYLLIINDELIQ